MADFARQSPTPPSKSFFETSAPTKTLPTVFVQHATTSIKCPTDGRPTYLAYSASDSLSPNTSRRLNIYFNTMDLATDSRNTLSPKTLISGRRSNTPVVCSTRMNTSILRPSIHSSLTNPTLILPSGRNDSLPVPSSKRPTYGRSSLRSSDDSNRLLLTTSLAPISNHEPKKPVWNQRRASSTPKLDPPRTFSPHFIIHSDQTLPLVQFNTPANMVPRVSFSPCDGPPSVKLHVEPDFTRFFKPYLTIHKIAQVSTSASSSIFPTPPFYLITINIVPTGLTELTHPDMLRPITSTPTAVPLPPPMQCSYCGPPPPSPIDQPQSPIPPPYILEPPREMMSAMWNAIPPNTASTATNYLDDNFDFAPSTRTTTLSQLRSRACNAAKGLLKLFRRNGNERQGLKFPYLPNLLTLGHLAVTPLTVSCCKAHRNHTSFLKITLSDNNTDVPETCDLRPTPSPTRRTLLTQLEISNQLPQVPPFTLLFCASPNPITFYGLFFCSSDYAHYVLLISGYDGYLIPQTMSPFLTMFSYDFELLTSFMHPKLLRDFFIGHLITSIQKLGLTLYVCTLGPCFILFLNLFVQFSNFTLYSQEPNKEYFRFVNTGNNICWLKSDVIIKSKLESIKLLSRTGMDLAFKVQTYSLINNLSLRLEQEKLSAQNSKTIKRRASQRCNLNSIEFPAPHVRPRCITTQVKPEGTFPIQKTLQLTNQWPFKEPARRLTLPKRLDHDHPNSEPEITKIHFTDTDTPYEPETDDEYIIYPTYNLNNDAPYMVFTAYKRVDKKIHPVSMQLPPDCEVIRRIPEDPLLTLPQLVMHPPEFVPTTKITQERLTELNINATGFLWPEEEKLFQHIMRLNEKSIAFEDV